MRIESLADAREIVKACHCPKCGKRRIPTASGATCMEHGILLGVRHDWFDVLDRAIEMLELPVAHVVEGPIRRFMIDGLPGEYRATAAGPVRAVDTVYWPRIRQYQQIEEKP